MINVNKWWFFAGMILVFSDSLRCCTCLEQNHYAARSQYPTIFHGRVVGRAPLKKITLRDPETGLGRSWIPFEDDFELVSFAVDAVWKSKLPRTVKVFTIYRPSICDWYAFEDGEEYLIYASLLSEGDRKRLGIPEAEGPVYGIGMCPGPIEKIDLGGAKRIVGYPAQITKW